MNINESLSNVFKQYTKDKNLIIPDNFPSLRTMFEINDAKKSTLSLYMNSFNSLQLMQEYCKIQHVKSSYSDIFENIVKNSIKNNGPLFYINSKDITYRDILQHCLSLSDRFIEQLPQEKIKEIYYYIDLMTDCLNELYGLYSMEEYDPEEIDTYPLKDLDEIDITDFDYGALLGIEKSLIFDPVMRSYLLNSPFSDCFDKLNIPKEYSEVYEEISTNFLINNIDILKCILKENNQLTDDNEKAIQVAQRRHTDRKLKEIILRLVGEDQLKFLFVLWYFVQAMLDFLRELKIKYENYMKNINTPFVQDIVKLLIELKVPIISECGFTNVVEQYGLYVEHNNFYSSGNSLTQKQYYYLKNVVFGSTESINGEVYRTSRYLLSFEEYTRLCFVTSDRGFKLFKFLISQELLYDSIDNNEIEDTPCQPYLKQLIQPFSKTTLSKLYEQFSNGGFNYERKSKP